jgi:phage shock protein A
MPDPKIDVNDFREAIWQLSYKINELRAENEALKAALEECEHQTHSLRVWGGMEWSYHPPQAGRIAKTARAALDASRSKT